MLLNSLFNFQFGDFTDVDPDWFDWFSLVASSVISILSIILAFYVARRIYNLEKTDKITEEEEIRKAEISFFNDSLDMLKASIQQQLQSLEQYVANPDFSVQLSSGVNSEFLQFINARSFYQSVGVGNKDKINALNRLMANLYAIKEFRSSLQGQLIYHIEKYNYHEAKYYDYRKLVYPLYYQLCNNRGSNFTNINGAKNWSFLVNDTFMIRYSQLREAVIHNPNIFTENGLNRENFFNEFIFPLIHIAADYLPEDSEAIEIHDISNDVASAFKDMQRVTDAHITSINSNIDVLKGVVDCIDAYRN